ncbi:MAG: hypothetical protein J6J38_09425 [Lachnospiraceae bacterium]|nr:hypothetical protein [Lachnospiraceae bacterium]
MGAVFIKILNMSFTAGLIVPAVLLVRVLFQKKAPKALFPILWAIVAVRLVCPVVLESRISLIPNTKPMHWEAVSTGGADSVDSSNYSVITDPEEAKQIAEEYQRYINGLKKQPEKIVVSVVSGPAETGNPEEADYFIQRIAPEETVLPDEIMEELKANGTYKEITEDGVTNTYTLVYETTLAGQKISVYEILAVIWIVGAAGMLFYILFSYLRVYRKVKESAPEAKNVRICDGIDSPFILGLICPKIYLPSNIAEEDKEYVLAHERAHLKRFDHLWKPLGFLLLSVYWFHPLLWVAYILLCKDIEYACDEKVMKELGAEHKKNYSTALINCSVPKRMISACPLAFGENGVKGRITSVLHYKKPAFWIILTSVLLCTVLAVCFLTDPMQKKKLPQAGDIITFGTYEQDNVTENGAEPIEWLVVDVFDGKATLLSKYGLDAKPFHEDGSVGVTWEECSLRVWLNETFYQTAFNEREQKQIVSTRLDNHSSGRYYVSGGGTVTEDKVYLLSKEELSDFLGYYKEYENGKKVRKITATAYAKAQGAWEEENEAGVSSPWLLRTPGLSAHHVSRVNPDGTLSDEVYHSYGGNAIRPAIRISLADAEYEIISTENTEETEETAPVTRNGRFRDLVALSEAKPGYVVQFGSYEQNNDETDGPEPIEWYVLDVKDGKAYLLSKYVLENMTYHDRKEDVTWETCALRTWLNGTFYDTAFNAEEKQQVATTLLENVWNPWNTSTEYDYTEDKVFLPAIEDVLWGAYSYSERAPESTTYIFGGYFQTDTERIARSSESLFFRNGETGSFTNYGYWLRASSRTEYRPSDAYNNPYPVKKPYTVVAGINPDGSLSVTADLQVDYGNGVRPAIWVNLGNAEDTDVERYSEKEIKEAFLEYLNHQAYLYPSEYPQTKYKCNFEVYGTTDSKMKRVYLKTDENGTSRWYLCTPTVYMDEEAPLTITPMEQETMNRFLSEGEITYLGKDTVKVPVPKKPEYHKNTELNLAEYKESIACIADVLYQHGYTEKDGYRDVLKLEAWISEFDMEKKLFPYAYVIINDAYVYETSFTKQKGLYSTFYEDNHTKDTSLIFPEEGVFYALDEFDGRSIKPLASMDEKQAERIKDCAVLHYVHEPDFTETITVAGKKISLPKQNLEISVGNRIGMAFVPQKNVGNRTYYTVYRSMDNGNSWYLVSEEFQTAGGDVIAIRMPTEDHVVCYFEGKGNSLQSCYLSEDGGVTWSLQEQAVKPYADLEKASVGTSVVFGSYEQDSDRSNGDEELEWLVLDRRGEQVLLLSRYGLDVREYHDRAYEDVTWENSFAREWLQQSFYAKAFSAKERAMIVKTENENGDGIMSDTTEDYVFLLSAEEVLNGKAWDGTPYFATAVDRITIPTAYRSYSSWLYSNDESSEWAGITTEWWLRTTGNAGMYADVVTKSGKVLLGERENYSEDVSVRPAIWVDLSLLADTENK